MLLFEEDLARRQTITARFPEAQARLGLGDEADGLRLLEEVLTDLSEKGRQASSPVSTRLAAC